MTLSTRTLPVADAGSLGRFEPANSLDHWEAAAAGEADAASIESVATAARYLRETDVPVGFPTETVYGLAADVTRSSAVRGIFSVKGRPSDNPLIVHVCDLDMVRGLLGTGEDGQPRELPAIYRPLVERFWPGPLTILLDVPDSGSGRWTLAPEVTAGLRTFGCRLPDSPLARTLIRLAQAPLAAPSANASTRPSPTTAQHVVDDLDGRIVAVLDGGPCAVGVESTVVDGLCEPPVVLRPGGISMAQLRSVPGWEKVQRAYRDQSAGQPVDGTTATAPRAPGMKYKHYSPKARVVLYEATGSSNHGDGGMVQDVVREIRSVQEVREAGSQHEGATRSLVVGVIRTTTWPALGQLLRPIGPIGGNRGQKTEQAPGHTATYRLEAFALDGTTAATVLELDLGRDQASVAHGLFSGLRDLDARGADVILVEGLDDRADDIAAAVMNRLRKAASEVR
ncbi:translation initiation protein sua5 [Grosmannia clavigera kw1407]|uniref:Threonylcarbamoyl-AMP synthase n=1 Tax=Grosmannia clavigera (strain kw1407 / UAMH 11150) TaxID=655863 RepID=F0XEB5_GROCL|nr:translation initiation protein sua5 [Grosmannia clavigera kw1407]EFX04421.1 translation initiation protein sua5 [Grosmannia clavigera kw1407]